MPRESRAHEWCGTCAALKERREARERGEVVPPWNPPGPVLTPAEAKREARNARRRETRLQAQYDTRRAAALAACTCPQPGFGHRASCHATRLQRRVHRDDYCPCICHNTPRPEAAS